jgi:hypothetical protein
MIQISQSINKAKTSLVKFKLPEQPLKALLDSLPLNSFTLLHFPRLLQLVKFQQISDFLFLGRLEVLFREIDQHRSGLYMTMNILKLFASIFQRLFVRSVHHKDDSFNTRKMFGCELAMRL